MMKILLILLGIATPAVGACPSWVVKEACCPSACAVKQGRNWSRADAILRACMMVNKCDGSKTATVNMRCDCK